MNIVCLDMEGVLVPEIWIAFAEATGIEELKKTTRDEPDYDKLMEYRLNILKEHGTGNQRDPGYDQQNRPDARCKGISGRAAQHHAGHHHQRHIRTVRTASDEKAGLADTVLQHAGNRRRRHDLKA